MDLSNLEYLYDGVDIAEFGGGFLYDDSMPDSVGPEQLFDKDYVVVICRKHVQDPYGGIYQTVGDPIKVICSVEGREQQAGMFSISGAEDKTPSGQTQGGLQEVSPLQIMAREWPGDIHSRIWYKGDYYDADGAPTWRGSGTKESQHWEIKCRRVVVGAYVDGGIPEPEWTEEVGGRGIRQTEQAAVN